MSSLLSVFRYVNCHQNTARRTRTCLKRRHWATHVSSLIVLRTRVTASFFAGMSREAKVMVPVLTVHAAANPRRVARRFGRSDCVGTSGSERCHLHEDQAQDTDRRLRLEWCRARANWTAAEWDQVVFSDESRFNLSSDDNRVRV
ncbi:transposable element Tcb1 transposase [Trichonephila clavipes]|nr:transposable element Tcb1 transposase [Trichonephila clavipes]